MAQRQKYPIDTGWFHDRLKARNESTRALARHLGIEASAASRMLNGERQMKVAEEAGIAEFLGVSPADVIAHRGAANLGFAEMPQAPFGNANQPPSRDHGEGFKADKAPYRHPLFGVWVGKVTLLPDYDYTQPADPEWGKVHDD